MALPLQSCVHPTHSARPRPTLHFQPTTLHIAVAGANARYPRWVFSKFPNLQRNCGKGGALSARSCISSEGFRENKGGSVCNGDGLIIVDHGSRRPESNLMLNEFVAMFRDRTGYAIVEPAHMELAVPSIKDAFKACVQQGANRVIISPFFLFPGRHWHWDIPSLAAEAAEDHPGVLYIVTAPLGLHELLVDVVNDRIRYCLRHAVGDAEECTVCAGTGKCRLC